MIIDNVNYHICITACQTIVYSLHDDAVRSNKTLGVYETTVFLCYYAFTLCFVLGFKYFFSFDIFSIKPLTRLWHKVETKLVANIGKNIFLVIMIGLTRLASRLDVISIKRSM